LPGKARQSKCFNKTNPESLPGKARQPKCFNKTNPESLPVTNRSNKKAWISSKLYEKYLQILNRKLKRQKKEKNKNYLLTMYHATQTQIYPTLKLNFFYLTCLSHRKWIRKYLKPPS
jgi:hypothetical protein